MSHELPIPPPPADLDPKIAFILDLARALHKYGIPAHRVEQALSLLAARFGMEARFYSTPTAIIASFGAAAELRSCMIRVDPGELDLARLAALDELSSKVARGDISGREGSARLQQILEAPHVWRPVATVAAFSISSGAACYLLGGGPREVLVALSIGLLLGLFSVGSGKMPFVARMQEGVGAFVAAALAVSLQRLIGPYSQQLAIVAGIIVLLPGLTFVIGLTELATRNLMSGTTRLMSAMLVFLQIGFGVALGTRVGALLPPIPDLPLAEPLPGWLLVPALLLATGSFAILFRARARDAGWIVLAGCIGFFGARLGALMVGPELGAFVGALLLSVCSNVLSRALDKPGVITVLPGLILLVPGSVGFRSFDALLGENVLSGVQTFFSMGLIAIAIVTGFLLANALLPPRKVL